MQIVDVLFWIFAPLIGCLLLLTSFLFLQVFSACFFSGSTSKKSESSSSLPFTVLIPAHNEASNIGEAVRSVLQSCSDGATVLVVADNCNDATAQNARLAGAVVIERTNVDLRGKGYALDFGIQYLQHIPPKVVIIFDADCILERGSLAHLAAICDRRQRPIQAHYEMNWSKGAALTIAKRLRSLAWLFKNYIRPLGLRNLELACPLTGSGMALPWSLLSTLDLASGEIVEDMKLGTDCTLRGHGPIFYPEVKVTSQFPSDQGGLNTQRTRWEHGHLMLAARYGPKLLRRGFLSNSITCLGLGLDLMIPPMALIALLIVGFLSLFGVLALLGVFLGPVVLSLLILTLVLFTASIGLGIRKFGRQLFSWRDLVGIPAYVIGKMPLYLSFIFKRELKWIRTKRDDE